MTAKCANYWCSASRQAGEVSRVEFPLGEAGSNENCRIVSLWLCAKCAREMTIQVKNAVQSAFPCTPEPPSAAA